MESLIETFGKHAIKAAEQQEKSLLSYRENNPEGPLPDYMEEEFNLPLALRSICLQIAMLKAGIKQTRYD
jgi:hypothetical protein